MSNVQSLASRLQVVYGTPLPPVDILTEEEFSRGYEAGRTEGFAEVLRESEQHRAAEAVAFREHLDSISETMEAQHSAWLASLEPSLCGLAVAIAAKVIGSEISTNPAVIESWVRQALAEVTGDCKATLRVTPSWVSDSKAGGGRINPASTGALEGSSDYLPSDVTADSSMPYGCVIETEHGMIDARIDSMLTEALAALREAA